MEIENVIKLAQSYLLEHNKNSKFVFAAKKTFFFIVLWNEPGKSLKVKQIDVPEIEKYSTTDVERLFTLKNYPEPIVVTEETPRIEDESEYIDITSIPVYSASSSSTTSTSTDISSITSDSKTKKVNKTESIDNEITEDKPKNKSNCFQKEKNKKASVTKRIDPINFDFDPFNMDKDFGSISENCSVSDREKIYEHRKDYFESQTKMLYFLKIEDKSLARTEDQVSMRDEFQKNLVEVKKLLETGNLSQATFIKNVNLLEDLYRSRVRGRVRGFGNIGLNAVKTLSLEKPLLPMTKSQKEEANKHIKYRGLLDYWLRDQKELSPKKKI